MRYGFEQNYFFDEVVPFLISYHVYDNYTTMNLCNNLWGGTYIVHVYNMVRVVKSPTLRYMVVK